MIIMTKEKPVSISKPPNNSLAHLPIQFHTYWKVGRSVFGRKKDVDIDLGVMYKLKDGTKHVVQALGNLFGDLNNSPWIELDGDDQSGEKNGETIRALYGNALEFIDEIGIFVYIYGEGAGSLEEVRDAVTTIEVPGHEQLIIRHEGNAHSTKFCAIARLKNNGNGFTIQMDVEPINGSHPECDTFWGWGMEWQYDTK